MNTFIPVSKDYPSATQNRLAYRWEKAYAAVLSRLLDHENATMKSDALFILRELAMFDLINRSYETVYRDINNVRIYSMGTKQLILRDMWTFDSLWWTLFAMWLNVKCTFVIDSSLKVVACRDTWKNITLLTTYTLVQCSTGR